MTVPNKSTLWAKIFVEELARTGLQAVCIAPGSRSTPLTMAFANHPNIAVYSLLDERGAAFFALGMALASEKPVALLCTSGTATANFHPAIIEADASHVPLLVLTTDRPHELRHSGANQTIDQVKMYGDHIRWFVDAALPETDPPAVLLRSLHTLANRSMAAATGLKPGPVHLNFPFRKPLEPTPASGYSPNQLHDYGRKNGDPFTHITRGVLMPTKAQINRVVEAIQNSTRGLIVCGPRCPGQNFPEIVTQLAQHSGFPIFADALSGVRFGPHVNKTEDLIFAGYETFLQKDVVTQWKAPDLILRFGAMPISKMLGDYLGAISNSRRIIISGSGVWQDDTHTTTDFIWADPIATSRAVTSRLKQTAIPVKDATWTATLGRAEQQSRQLFNLAQAETFFEGAILADITDMLPHNATLFVANSLPVRHLDQFSQPKSTHIKVFANRGASGIDGTIAGALGVAAAGNLPLVLVIGDLSFYHDMNSLLALKRCGVNITIVLINNNGGGIFHRLPVSNFDPPFTDLFVTPHGLNFEPAARMFGADFTKTDDRDTFRRVFQESVGVDKTQIIEVTTDSTLHEKTRQKIIKRAVHQIIRN